LYERGDQIARDHEKHIDTQKAAGDRFQAEVKQNDWYNDKATPLL
jgi:hypothetical protein